MFSKQKILIAIFIVIALGAGVYFFLDSNRAKSEMPDVTIDASKDYSKVFTTAADLENKQDGGIGTGLYDEDIILGNPAAPVTIVEYASYTCSACSHFHAGPYKEIIDAYVTPGKVRFIYRDFLRNYPDFQAGLITHCLPARKAFAFAGIIYEKQSVWFPQLSDQDSANDNDFLRKTAKLAGLSDEAIDTCLADKEMQEKLLKVVADAQSLGVSSTPTLFIGKKAIVGVQSFEKYAQEIEAALQ